MSPDDRVEQHCRLEVELHSVRLLKLLQLPNYSAAREDELLDKMEGLWWDMSPDERVRLEEQRKIRFASDAPVISTELPAVDVADHQRLGLPPRISR